jgi:GntR family carbon starvation induced transcriptional regulator
MKEIKSLILECKLLPGEKIKGEFLKNKLNVGFSPIREALSRLVSTKLIESIDNVGFKIASITKSKLIEFYQSYAKIESLLFAESIENASDDWEASIIAELYCLAKIENSEKKVSYKIWSVYNERFHEALISACPLNELKQIRMDLILRKEWYHNLAYGQFENELIKVNHFEHNRLADLAIKRNVSSACVLLSQHTMHSLEPLIVKLDQLGYLTDL